MTKHSYFKALRQLRKERLKLERIKPSLKQLEIELVDDVNHLMIELNKKEICFPLSTIYDYLCYENITKRLRSVAREGNLKIRIFRNTPPHRYADRRAIIKSICFRRIKNG